MGQKIRREISDEQDISATTEYRKMREAYPEFSDDMVRQLALQARKLRTEHEEAQATIATQSFESEMREKLTNLIAQLTIKYNYNVYGREICIQTPKIELPYKSMAELAQYFHVTVSEKKTVTAETPVMTGKTIAPGGPPRSVAARSTDTHSGAAHWLFKQLRAIIIFAGFFVFFFGIYSAINTENAGWLILLPVGIAILFLIRLVPK